MRKITIIALLLSVFVFVAQSQDLKIKRFNAAVALSNQSVNFDYSALLGNSKVDTTSAYRVSLGVGDTLIGFYLVTGADSVNARVLTQFGVNNIWLPPDTTNYLIDSMKRVSPSGAALVSAGNVDSLVVGNWLYWRMPPGTNMVRFIFQSNTAGNSQTNDGWKYKIGMIRPKE